MRMDTLPAESGENGDVSLIDLLRVFARRRWWVIGGVVACFTAGFAYLLLASPRYEIKVYVDRPYENRVAALNLKRTSATGLAPYGAEQVFGYFMRELLSEHAFQRFFNELYLPSLSEEMRRAPEARLYKGARELLTITPPDSRRKDRQLYSVTIAASTPDNALRWVTGFFGRVTEDARKALMADARIGLDVAIRNTHRDLEELRLTSQTKRMDRIQQLKEALVVANAVGLRDPQVTVARPPSSDRVSPFVDGSLLYARGAKSLSAELEVLEKREDDDPFISGLRDTESRLRMWAQAISGDSVEFDVYRLDGEIVTPFDPVKPRKGLIMALAAMIGLISGLLLALVAEALSKVHATVRVFGVLPA